MIDNKRGFIIGLKKIDNVETECKNEIEFIGDDDTNKKKKAYSSTVRNR